MSRITYYAELDPYSGTVGQSVAAARALERDLRFAMLFYDVLLMPPRVLLEHAAVLPVAERLAPFVAAGRIGTSADKKATGPQQYIRQRVERAIQRLGKADRRIRSQSSRRLRLERSAERWTHILPVDWRVRRSVSGQVQGVADTILQFCSERRGYDGLASIVYNLLDDHLQHDRDEPIRDMLLAGIGSCRYEVGPQEFGRYSSLIQSCYLHMGVAAHVDPTRSCHCFPGYFGTLVQTRLPGTAMAHALRPDGGRDRKALVARLRRFGIDVEQLLALPATELMELTTNEHWLALRDFLLRPQAATELEQTVAAALVRQNLRDGIHRAAAVTTEWTPANETELSAWQLPGQAILGAVRATRYGLDKRRPLAVLDLSTSELRNDEHGAIVTEQHKNLLSAFAAAGAHGLAVQQVWRMLAEQDRLDIQTLAEPESGQVAAKKAHADQARHRLNGVLKPFGLRVVSVIGVRGRWRLSGSLLLEGTAWHESLEDTVPSCEGLSGQMEQLFARLAESWPSYRSLATLADQIDRSPERTSRVLNRLKERLRALRSEWALLHSDRRYRLVRSNQHGAEAESGALAGEAR